MILTLVFLALIPAMTWLGLWQFHRYQQTNRQNGSINASLAAPPVAMDVISKPGGTVPADDTYRTVTAVGHYDTAHEFVVRQRTDAAGDSIGFYVVTPLVTAQGEAVLVNRGWVAPAGGGSASDYPPVPPAPSGQLTVTGRLRPDETSASTGIRERYGMPPRQYMLINSGQQAKQLPEPVVAGYLELTATSPTPPASDQAEQVPSPSGSNSSQSGDDAVVGKGVHLPYAIQWWLFALLIPAGWVVLFRRELRETREKRESAAAEAAA
ncbi:MULTISPECIES: SURF1 family cytochrome oxidase biogenesis protein [unclassified Kitasatospora]|uniref:SURF1 family cytochrome oxidase biogenesis protein n=1 Tax=unclassified Kitasatospora TaxID=2633591 RepID=UPI002474D7E2|nr:SURF1 family protein [Kitasatospora sp. MAP12-44]